MHIICDIQGAIARGELAVLARESAPPFLPCETFDDVRHGLGRRIVPIARRR